MTHTAYTELFKNLAKRYYLLQHEVGGRKSFFRANNEAEMQAGLATKADFPALLLQVYRGRLTGQDTVIQNERAASFEIRQHVGDLFNYEEIDNARTLCEGIAMDIIAKIVTDLEEENCSQCTKYYLDPSSVSYDFVGPIGQNEYGIRVTYSLSSPAFNLTSIDLSAKFL